MITSFKTILGEKIINGIKKYLRDHINSYHGNITAPIKMYKALLSEDAPIATKTSGTFTVGQIWTINTYNTDDDFSNMELISGTMNTNGCVFRATSTTPTHWAHLSDLSYDGAPYIVSTDSNGNLNPFVNTLGGDIIWSYVSAGYYEGTLTGAFIEEKIFLNISGGTVDVNQVVGWNDINSIYINVVSLPGMVYSDSSLYYSPITIEVYQ